MVHAYEPYPPVVDLLARNCAINRATIELRVVALGASAGRATLYVPVDDHDLIETSSSLNADLDPARIGSQVEVEVSTLDIQYPPGGVDPAVLKIDVESLEPDVLEALRAELDYVDVRLRQRHAVIGDGVRPDPEAWNHLWTPVEQLDSVTGLLRDLALEVVDDRCR